MNARARTLLVCALAPLLGSCSILSGRCLYELRSVIAEGSVRLSGTDSVHVQLIEDEQRDYQPDKNFSWQILGPSLKGDVIAIDLKDETGKVVYTFPLDAATTSQISGGFVRLSEGAKINGFYDLLSTKRATVVMTTKSHGTLTIPLDSVRPTDWNRPYCS